MYTEMGKVVVKTTADALSKAGLKNTEKKMAILNNNICLRKLGNEGH